MRRCIYTQILIYFVLIFSLSNKAYPEDIKNKVIENGSVPLFGKLELEIGEEIIIKESDTHEKYIFKYIKDIALDSLGNIYLLDHNLKFIFKYDCKGKYITRIGKIGQGPGEYNSPWSLFVDEHDNIYINDNLIALSKFSQKGKFITRINLSNFLRDKFVVDKKGYIYGLSHNISENGIKNVLIKIDQNGKVIKKIKEYQDTNSRLKRVGSGGIVGWLKHQYSQGAFFDLVLGNQICIGENMNYELHMYDLEGNLRFSFSKKENPQSISRDIAKLKKQIGKEGVSHYVFPKHKPYFRGILSDEKGRIYVVRVKSFFDKSKSETIDIFNKHGRYIYRTTFPNFPKYIKNGFIYVIDRNSEEEVIIKKLTIKNYDHIRY